MIKLAQTTVQRHGARGLYVGLGALVGGTAAKAGVRFLTYKQLKEAMADSEVRLLGRPHEQLEADKVRGTQGKVSGPTSLLGPSFLIPK